MSVYDALRGAAKYTEDLLAGKTIPPIAVLGIKQHFRTESNSVKEWKEKFYDILEKYNACLEKISK